MAFFKNNSNWCFILVLVFLLTLVGGPFMYEFELFGIQFYGLRLLLLAAVFYLIISRKLVVYNGKLSKIFFYFLIFWNVFAVVSLSWTPDKSAGLSDVFHILIGVLLYLFISTIKNKLPDFEKNIGLGLTITFIIIFLIAIWEMFFNAHLVSSFSETLIQFSTDHPIQNVPVVTFDNPNHYSIFLVFFASFGFYQIIERKNVLIWTALISISLFLCFVLESRFSILSIFSFVIIFIVYEFLIFKEKKKIAKYGAIFLFSSIFAFIGIFGFHPIQKNHKNIGKVVSVSKSSIVDKGDIDQEETISSVSEPEEAPINEIEIDESETKIYETTPSSKNRVILDQASEFNFLETARLIYSTKEDENLENVPINEIKNDVDYYTISITKKDINDLIAGNSFLLAFSKVPVPQTESAVSTNVRLNLLKNGFTVFKNSNFMGYGAGSYRAQLESLPNKADTGGIIDPHNFWVEILTQYGLIIALFFIGLILVSAWVILIALFKNKLLNKHVYVSFLLITFLLMSNSNSTYLPLALNWTILIFLVLYTEDLLKLKNAK